MPYPHHCMGRVMIHPARVQELNGKPARKGAYVLYWMQASQRAEWNHALEVSVEEANARSQPLIAVFGLTDAFPEANLRHYRFMLEGLCETRESLAKRGVQLVVRRGSPERVVPQLAGDASLVVCDRGYLGVERVWRETLAREAPCRVTQVESNVVVPVEAASDKEEYAAATLRPKIHRALPHYLAPLRMRALKASSLDLRFDSEPLDNVGALADSLKIDHTVKPVAALRGGASNARARLSAFIEHDLNQYDKKSADPSLGCVSGLSPYLHFGQISPLEIALAVRNAKHRRHAAKDAFLEQIIVRRELAINFVCFNKSYDTYDALPDWARKTLDEHRADRRDPVYSPSQLENAETDDPYWNAAQTQMLRTGAMHNYMRMYWGKKILEWTRDPRRAFDLALRLNNKYEVDGRDPNGFAGVAWVFGKHDRPWKERAVFGKVRYMNANGLKRKFDIDTYVRQVNELPLPSEGA